METRAGVVRREDGGRQGGKERSRKQTEEEEGVGRRVAVGRGGGQRGKIAHHPD